MTIIGQDPPARQDFLINTKFNPLDRLVSQANKIRLIGTSGQVNRIVRIMRPSAARPRAAGAKIPDNPVNPV